MLPAEPSREEILIKNIHNRMTTGAPIRRYGFRDLKNQTPPLKKEEAAKIFDQQVRREDFEGWNNID